MSPPDPPDASRRLLLAAFRGQRALRGFAALAVPAGPRLEIDARPTRYPDAFTAVTVREVIDQHLRQDRGNSVVLREPRDSEGFAMLADLLGKLPRRARWADRQSQPARQRAVLVPATRIADNETADLMASTVGSTAAALRIPQREASLIAMAVGEFAENALRHAPRGARPSLLSVCHAPEPNDLQVVTLSPYIPAPARTDPGDYLRDLFARSFSGLGGLASVLRLADARSCDVTLRVATGDGRLFARAGRARVDPHATNVPFLVSSVEIHMGS